MTESHKCTGCYIWENIILYSSCMFTPTLPGNTTCPCVECIVKSMCDREKRIECDPFDDYLKRAEPILYE